MTTTRTGSDGGAVNEFTQVVEDLRDVMDITKNLKLDIIEPIREMLKLLKDKQTTNQVINFVDTELMEAIASYS